MKTCQKCGTQYGDDTSFCLRDGEVLQDDHARMIGRILDGQYEIESFIAQGGMGAVYRARHTLLGDRVAIKILPPEMRRNTEWLKRFQREGQAARRFHHQNSVVVHDFRTSSEGEVYLVMEYVEGRTLDEELAARGGRLSPPEILKIIEPVASVLDAAHAQGVVHRDLKPSNIMLTTRGVVKVLDLGIAKLSDMESADMKLTTAGQMLGTPYYMSPEQWGEMQRDGRVEIDGRADVYSLGVVVYEMTTGQRPFEAASALELRQAHCRYMPHSPAALDASLPTAWASAILRALAKDRNDRQQSAGEFVHELRASLGENSLRGNEARAEAPTIINPMNATGASLARETPMNLSAATMQGRGQATPHPQAPPFAPFTHHTGVPAAALNGRSKSRPVLIICLLIALVLGATAAGGYAIWKWKAGQQQGTAPAAKETKRPSKEPNGNVADDGAKVIGADEAFMRYHLLLGASALEMDERATGSDPVKPGMSVQIALTPGASGYLYMIGEDTQGHPVVLPTGMLEPEIEVTKGEAVEVPQLATIKLNDRPGTETFTLIFTEKRLDLPFVSETLPLDGTFRKLTAAEQQRIEELREEAAPVEIEYTETDGGLALVKLAGERGTKPVVIDITLTLEK